jgi:hypothetical protein
VIVTDEVIDEAIDEVIEGMIEGMIDETIDRIIGGMADKTTTLDASRRMIVVGTSWMVPDWVPG